MIEEPEPIFQGKCQFLPRKLVPIFACFMETLLNRSMKPFRDNSKGSGSFQFIHAFFATNHSEKDSMETLTKADLSKQLMERLDFNKNDADLLVKTFLERMIQSLRDGDGVELRGFGSFRIRDRLARQGRNPRTGKSVEVPPKRVVYFKLGKELKIKLVDA